jgi:glycerophosphoryl diester phosphodiesterase
MVVIHDATLERTTNGSGPVTDHTLEQMKTLDAGGWFDAKFMGERLPTLEAVFDELGNDMHINVELKPDPLPAQRSGDSIEALLTSLIQLKGLRDTVLVSSFEKGVLERIRLLDRAIHLALLSDLPVSGDMVAFCREMDCTSFHPNTRIIDRRGVERMHAENILVFPFTVNAIAEFQGLKGFGVDGIITDDPLKFLNLG